ncbi:hypothetical protein ACN42_g4448 [Penicillium freii]|uniref:Uncharacterized protein n=1 Tax=Penicillium freii TaxID=48697 RepID=A0A101MLC7_PENFR|nr:hypothetical protein ACN42_g4448 [Penicillium freii]
MLFGLSPARSDSSTREEVPIQYINKLEDTNNPEKPNKPQDANKPEDTNKSDEDNEPHKVPGASFIEQTPKKEAESTPGKHPNQDPSQIRSGSRTTTAGKKYYKHLRVPPNSPNRDSFEMTFKGGTRVDVIPDKSFMRPFIGRETEPSWQDEFSGLIDAGNYNLIMKHRMYHEYMMRRSRCRTKRPKHCPRATSLDEYFDLHMYLRGPRNPPKLGYSFTGPNEGSS